MMTTATLRRTEVRTILKRNRGSIKAIADDLGITITTVGDWMRGKTTSARVAAAAQAKALELLEAERKAMTGL
jgi:transcriptional regulator with XRE-family HTH domain